MSPANHASTDGMVELPGGEFLMGNAGPTPTPMTARGPSRRVRLDPFWIDAVRRLQRRLRPASSRQPAT